MDDSNMASIEKKIRRLVNIDDDPDEELELV